MTTSTIPARLRAACRGHPAAQIPWPHRLLHEAADRIEELDKAGERVLAFLEEEMSRAEPALEHHLMVEAAELRAALRPNEEILP